jgi:hypothetical protein
MPLWQTANSASEGLEAEQALPNSDRQVPTTWAQSRGNLWGLTLTQWRLTWQNQPVPPNWFSRAESQVGWGGPNGLDPKVDPTFLSECVSSAGTEFLFKKGFPNGFLYQPTPYMVMNCIFLASHVHLWFTFYHWWMVMILSSTKFQCRMDEGNWNFCLIS